MKKEKGSIALIILVFLLTLGLGMLMMDWAIIDVQTLEKDKVHIIVPVPLQLAGLALQFIPEDQLDADIPQEARDNKELIIRSLNELKNAPDTTFVSVKTPEAQVKIAKEKGNLTLDVVTKEATVHGVLPLNATAKVLSKWDWQHPQPELAIKILADCSTGTILSVDSKEAKVNIYKW